jgi:7-cyano-7-deazaguanine synthase in queuosine biosynthesis
MGTNSYVLLCNGAQLRSGRGAKCQGTGAVDGDRTRLLWTYGAAKNVRLTLDELTDPLLQNLPPRIVDLLELAALVYGADQCCRRMPGRQFDYGDLWHRQFTFYVAVRCPQFWKRASVLKTLSETLTFLSDDDYDFQFQQMSEPPSVQQYLEFHLEKNSKRNPNYPLDQVMLMSGGLDSLAGAVEQVLEKRRSVAMVSHKPVEFMATRQRELISEIAARANERQLIPLRVPVTANMIGVTHADPTQRTRSFLYAALGAAVAFPFGLKEICFYENGIVSVNLPLCAQEVGGRATRTTHPQTLNGISKLFSLVYEQPFSVKNQYFWLTKQEVLEKLKSLQHSDLARKSISCIHTRGTTHPKPHCGMCSQCLSRRIAALGAEYGLDDPPDGYRLDVLTAPRATDEERILAERFLGHARGVERMMAVQEFNAKYAGELARVYPYLGLATHVAGEQLFELHHRHALQVGEAIIGQIEEHGRDHWRGNLGRNSALAYAFALDRADDRSNDAACTKSRPDGLCSHRELVWGGIEHDCELTKKQMNFLAVVIETKETDIARLMHRTKGAVWKEQFLDTKKKRDKISQFLCRLNARLSEAKPPLGISFSLRRHAQVISRNDPEPAPLTLR